MVEPMDKNTGQEILRRLNRIIELLEKQDYREQPGQYPPFAFTGDLRPEDFIADVCTCGVITDSSAPYCPVHGGTSLNSVLRDEYNRIVKELDG